MKSALIVVLVALMGLAAARSFDQKELLAELKDLMKRRPGPPGDRPPPITCNSGANFKDVLQKCTGFMLDEDDLEDDDDDRRRSPGGKGPRLAPYCHLQMVLGDDAATVAQCIQSDCPAFEVKTDCPLTCNGNAFFDVVADCVAPYANSIDEDALEGKKPFCNLVSQLGQANAEAIGDCIQRQCDVPEEFKYQNQQCSTKRQMGSCGRTDAEECAAQVGIELPSGKGGPQARELLTRGRGQDRFCKGVERFGAPKVQAMSQCLNEKCDAPLMDASTCDQKRRGPGRGGKLSDEMRTCLEDNVPQCAAAEGVTLGQPEEKRRMKKDPFCFAVYKFGEAKAEAINNCLVTACQVPARSASECPAQEDVACVLQNIRGCVSDAGVSMPARGLATRDLKPFCKAVDRLGGETAELISSCLATACQIPARTADECDADDLKRKLMKLLDLQ